MKIKKFNVVLDSVWVKDDCLGEVVVPIRWKTRWNI